jgi:phosphate/sulfate permease
MAATLLLAMKQVLKEPRLYKPPEGDDRPPRWVRVVLILTCGGVSFAHGSNDGQKGMGLLLLVLIGFMPVHYALTVNRPEMAPEVAQAAAAIRSEFSQHNVELPQQLDADLTAIATYLAGRTNLDELATVEETDAAGNPVNVRWELRQAIFRTNRTLKAMEAAPERYPAAMLERLQAIRKKQLTPAIEFVPLWVVIGTALALGIGTCIGYKRIVITVAEKIGKTHLTYGQGAAAEAVAAATILGADFAHLPVSTTQVLSSGVAGTMAANGSGIQAGTCRKILLAWVLTLPACVTLAAVLFWIGRCLVG